MTSFQIDGHEVLLDEQDVQRFVGKKLRVQVSRNTKYCVFGKNGTMHREIMNVTDPRLVVDHINGNGLDNRKQNLRVVTFAENTKNRRHSRSKNNDMPPGMWPCRGKIAVQITNCGKKIFVGYFDDQSKAHAALNAARIAIGRPPL